MKAVQRECPWKSNCVWTPLPPNQKQTTTVLTNKQTTPRLNLILRFHKEAWLWFHRFEGTNRLKPSASGGPNSKRQRGALEQLEVWASEWPMQDRVVDTISFKDKDRPTKLHLAHCAGSSTWAPCTTYIYNVIIPQWSKRIQMMFGHKDWPLALTFLLCPILVELLCWIFNSLSKWAVLRLNTATNTMPSTAACYELIALELSTKTFFFHARFFANCDRDTSIRHVFLILGFSCETCCGFSLGRMSSRLQARFRSWRPPRNAQHDCAFRKSTSWLTMHGRLAWPKSRPSRAKG